MMMRCELGEVGGFGLGPTVSRWGWKIPKGVAPDAELAHSCSGSWATKKKKQVISAPSFSLPQSHSLRSPKRPPLSAIASPAPRPAP